MYRHAERRRAHAAIRGKGAPPLPGLRAAARGKKPAPPEVSPAPGGALRHTQRSRGGHNAPPPQAHPGAGAPAPARAPMLRPFARSAGGPGAGWFIRPGHAGISAVIPAALSAKGSLLRSRPPAPWKENGQAAGCPAVLWREQPVSLRHFYVNEIACGSAVAVFRIPACCYFIDISARLEGENISIDGRPFAVCGRLSPIFIAPAFHAENGIGFLCKSQCSRCFRRFMRRGQ